jgi:hypothetical protein
MSPEFNAAFGGRTEMCDAAFTVGFDWFHLNAERHVCPAPDVGVQADRYVSSQVSLGKDRLTAYMDIA